MLYKEIKGNNLILKVYYDEDGLNPREDFSNLGKMITFSKYGLGDSHNYENVNDFFIDLAEEYSKSDLSDRTMEQLEKIILKHYIILPIYIYDHSGITIKTTPFSDKWDSGLIGYIYVSKESIREIYNVKRISLKLKKDIEWILKEEVSTYDMYLTGDVYYYDLIDCKDNCVIDTIGGFFGSDIKENGILGSLSDTQKKDLNLLY